MTLKIFEFKYMKRMEKHLQNLVAMAYSDGHFHEEEERLLYLIGDRCGISPEKVQQIIEHKKDHDPVVPDNWEERIRQLFDLTMIIFADGEVDKNERKYLEEKVSQYGFDQQLTEKLLKCFAKGIPERDKLEDLKLEAMRYQPMN